MRRLLTVIVLGAAVTACGGDDAPAPEAQVTKAVRDYLTAVASGNHERACATLTNEAQEQVVEEVTAAYPDPDDLSCGDAIRELAADLSADHKRTLLNAKVAKVTLRSGSATAEVEKLADPVTLRRVDDAWRVDKSTFEVTP